MPLRSWFARSVPQSGAPGLRSLTVSREEWRRAMQDVAATGGRLVTLWAGSDNGVPVVRAAFLTESAGLLLCLPLPDARTPYPGAEDLFPAAARMQRALADLCGLQPTGAMDRRPWLRHAAWPEGYWPLLETSTPEPEVTPRIDTYEFVRVAGDGVHEIPVGPVHAGTIEPGHFRFSVVGEKVLRLEERLGYVHKGIEQRFTQLPILEGHRLACRVSGDSAVAFSWAYCQALEGIASVSIPARAAWLRALCLELERVANHLGDLGALANDAGFAFGLGQFSRLKEHLLRATVAAFGSRYLMDTVVPGGIAHDLTEAGSRQLTHFLLELVPEILTLRTIYEEHEGLRDRFKGTGAVMPELAARLGLTGLAGRASGQAFDLRADQPCEPYGELRPTKYIRREGDVDARVAVRFDELMESCHLIQRILNALPAGAYLTVVPVPADETLGVGLIEGWRGPVFVALEAGRDGAIRRCHPHDPSWQNWPVLEHAILGNIVPDFPLINKSFNLSYSGHDL
jgi:Ni,Fe-hydrogenase III large subunit/Ni,Fe-hydrogenase III component G